MYTQDTRSAASPGDHLSNDYEFNVPIPDVTSDTYSGTIDYLATTDQDTVSGTAIIPEIASLQTNRTLRRG